jgi:hypothetical protein
LKGRQVYLFLAALTLRWQLRLTPKIPVMLLLLLLVFLEREIFLPLHASHSDEEKKIGRKGLFK